MMREGGKKNSERAQKTRDDVGGVGDVDGFWDGKAGMMLVFPAENNRNLSFTNDDNDGVRFKQGWC